MSYRDRRFSAFLGSAADRLAPGFAAALLARDLPCASAAETARAAENVRASIDRMPDVLRAGVSVATGLVGLALCVSARRPYFLAPAEVRRDSARRIAERGLPVAVEFVRLSRGLGLASVYEERTPALLRAAAGEEKVHEV